jgi:uncharacterized protein
MKIAKIHRALPWALAVVVAAPSQTVFAAGRAVGVPHSEERSLHSSNTGKNYRIFIAKSVEPTPPAGYPVIYVLDANASFATVAETVRLQSRAPDVSGVLPAIVVGVAYPGDEDFNSERRWWDFTPVPTTAQQPGPDGPRALGGAAAFLRFLEEELKPQIEKEFKIDRQRQTLLGHSLGGYFALHVLFNQPQAFQTYIASSPSLWWDEKVVLRELERYASSDQQGRAQRALLFSAGEYERRLSPSAAASEDAARMAPRIKEDAALDATFARKLEELAGRGLRVKSIEIPGEDHISVIPVAINHAVRFALAPPTSSADR